MDLRLLNQTGITIIKFHNNNLSFLPPAATESQTTPLRQVTKFDMVGGYFFNFDWYVRMETAHVGFTTCLPDYVHVRGLFNKYRTFGRQKYNYLF